MVLIVLSCVCIVLGVLKFASIIMSSLCPRIIACVVSGLSELLSLSFCLIALLKIYESFLILYCIHMLVKVIR